MHAFARRSPAFRCTLTLVLVGALVVPCRAGLLDDITDLQGKTVVYAGEIEQLTCPIGDKYDCTTWPMEFYKTASGLREICFVPSGYVRCSFRCKGLIAVGDDKKPYVFFIESIGGEMKKASLEIYKCPSMF